MNARLSTGYPVDIRAVVYAIDEHGHEILKENTELQIPMFFQHLTEFKQYVWDFIGVDSIVEEVGFSQFDMLLSRLTEDNERFAIRTQHQYSMEMMRFFSGQNDQLEVMICKKIIACVKGRLGSILIVPMETGSSAGRRSADIQNPVMFVRDDQSVESPPSQSQNDLDLTVSPNSFERRRKKNPQKVEDYDLFEKIRRTDIVQRNQRQQASFEELAAMLKELNGSIPVSEGKFRCGNCGKERLVCPNRNNIGRIKYFRRKHYDNCMASGGRGMYRGRRGVNPFVVDDSGDGSVGRFEPVDKSRSSDNSGETTPTKYLLTVQGSDNADSEVVFVKHEQDG